MDTITTLGEIDIEKLFDFNFLIINNKPKFTIKLKNAKKIVIDGRSLTSSKLSYFQKQLNNEELARQAYEFRKKFFNIRNVFQIRATRGTIRCIGRQSQLQIKPFVGNLIRTKITKWKNPANNAKGFLKDRTTWIRTK